MYLRKASRGDTNGFGVQGKVIQRPDRDFRPKFET